MTAHSRRWSFSLRTLFVMITVLGCWLGWCVGWVAERRALRAESELVRSKYGKISGADYEDISPLGDTFSRRLLGIVGEVSNQDLLVFYLYDDRQFAIDADGHEHVIETADCPKVRRSRLLFPEAQVTAVGVDKSNMNNTGHALDGLISE